TVADYLNAQIRAGAQAVQIFDSWGGVLTPQDYREFSLNYMQRIISQIEPDANGQAVPVIVFTKGGGLWLEEIAQSGAHAVGLDWMTPIGQARQRIGNKVALQGNLDPSALYARPEIIRHKAQQIIEDFGPGAGHIFNLGHGITPQVNPEHVKVLVDAVHEYGRNPSL